MTEAPQPESQGGPDLRNFVQGRFVEVAEGHYVQADLVTNVVASGAGTLVVTSGGREVGSPHDVAFVLRILNLALAQPMLNTRGLYGQTTPS